MAWRALVSRRMHELRFVFRPEASSSEAVKAFLTTNYDGLKTLNPTFPFLVRRGADEEDPYLLATRAARAGSPRRRARAAGRAVAGTASGTRRRDPSSG